MADPEDNADVIVINDDDDSDVSVVGRTEEPKPTTSYQALGLDDQDKETMECPICLQSCIHPARLPCGHIFCFLCVKGVAYKNRRCAMCRREIPPEFLDHPQLVHGIQDLCNTKSTEDGYQWFYEGRNGWWQYDERTSQDIEEAYKKNDKSCTILVAGYVYIVDFEGMVQKRQTDPSRARHVKRDLATIPKKGVAGLRIEGNTVATDSDYASQVYQAGSQSTNIVTDIPDELYHTEEPSGNFMSTIAAADAAIRIANDIIGSTLALADDSNRSNRTSSGSSGSRHSSSSSQGSSSHDNLLGESDDILQNSIDHRPTGDQNSLDLFQQTLDNFRSLTLGNIADLSDSDGDDLLL